MRTQYAPGNAAAFGAFVHAGPQPPNAGYPGAQPGLYTPIAGYGYPQLQTLPFFPMHFPVPHVQGPYPGRTMHYHNAELDSPQYPGTSSSTASVIRLGQEDTVSPLLSQEEGREFRDSDDPPSDEEAAGATAEKNKFTLAEQSVKLLTEVTAKPLKNTKRRQLLDRFPQPTDCDQVHTPKLDESIIPDSSRKEDRLLSRLQPVHNGLTRSNHLAI